MTMLSLIGCITRMRPTDLRRIVSHCPPCTWSEKEEHRYTGMRGVRLEFGPSRVQAVGTDGRVLVNVEADHNPVSRPQGDEKWDPVFDCCNVDMTALNKVKASLGASSTVVTVTFNEHHAFFTWANNRGKKSEKAFAAKCPLIIGRFPKWETVIAPMDRYECLTVIEAGDWTERWKGYTAAPATGYRIGFGGSEANQGRMRICLTRVEDMLFLPVKRSDGGDRSMVNPVCLNLEFVMDFLRRCSGPVEIRTGGPHDPVRMDIPHVSLTIMPIATGDDR